MSTIVIDPPAALVVSLEEAKVHLRVDFEDDDEYIERLIKVCTATIDGPGVWLGRCLIQQTLEKRIDCFPACGIDLRCPPVLNVVSVKYDDNDGTEQDLDDSYYRLVGAPDAPRLALAYGKSWPTVRWQSEAVRIQYVAGYGDEGEDVPEPIRQAVMLMVSELYEKREVASDATRSELPFAVTSLLSNFRIFS